MTVTYRLIRAWVALLARSWYRIEWRGERIPDSVPVVLVVNHNNGLVDGHFQLDSTDRAVHVLAKVSLFEIPVLGWIVRNVGAIPIYRKKDGVDTSRNADAFRGIHNSLGRREVIAIFPEGESRAVPYLRELKSGAARMALGAEDAADWTLDLQIVPVGITYEDAQKFRSRAQGWIGAPIPTSEYHDAWEESPVTAYRAMGAAAADELRELVLDVEPGDDQGAAAAEAACAAERVLLPSDEPLAFRRQLANDALVRLREEDPAGHERRVQATLQLDRNLRAHALTADDVFDDSPPGAGRLLAEIAARSVVGVPLVLLAALVWLWPAPVARLIGRRGASTPEKAITVAILVGFALSVTWSIVLTFVGIRFFTWPLVIGVVLTGLFALPHAWDNVHAIRRAFGRLRLAGAPDRRASLREAMTKLDGTLRKAAQSTPSAAHAVRR